MKQKFKDKVVVITGGTSGIGLACAKQYGLQGAKVAITGRNEDRLRLAAKELSALSIEHTTIVADAAEELDNEHMVSQVLYAFNRIDTLICNAGISMRALFQDLDLEVFKKVMDINFYGTIYAVKYALPYILSSKGSIIGISSINGYRGTPARSAYTASKYAMQGFFEALRTEHLNDGIHILVACPGFTASNIRKNALNADGQSQGESPKNESQLMSSEQVAHAIFQAHMKRKRDLVLTTQGKLTVFLNKFFPSWMDKKVYEYMKKEQDTPIT